MMTQAHKAQKQPQDLYAQQGKELASLVQRLRGWVGSDPSRVPELTDALIQLTAHRLLGHGYAAAAEDAQDAVRRAAELLAAKGPIGPYTSVSDAARYVTAVIHLATIQAGMGLTDAAGKTIESLKDIQEQLGEGLLRQLQPQVAIWALSCSARAALASGDIAAANACADATLVRLAESGLADDPDSQYLAMDVDRLTSDCRWAADRVEEAIAFLHAAKDRYEEVVDGRLEQPARLSPALLDRLAEPLFSIYQDMADRLAAIGEVDLRLMTRRRLIELLRGLTGRLGDPARLDLVSALTDLAHDLLEYGRVDEADAAAGEAGTIEQSLERSWKSYRGSHTRNGKPREPVGVVDTAATDCFVRGDDRGIRWPGRSEDPPGREAAESCRVAQRRASPRTPAGAGADGGGANPGGAARGRTGRS